MNENINLCEILKGHEDEAFYCSLIGSDVKLKAVFRSPNESIKIKDDKKGTIIWLRNSGNLATYKNGECILFPSKDQRDWNKWIKEQKKSKSPKTWDILKNSNKDKIVYRLHGYSRSIDIDDYPRGNLDIEKSALALLKIHQLIEVGYGGNIKDNEWRTIDPYYIWYNTFTKCFMINTSTLAKIHIAFHTKEQAEEFLKYPENIQLLKDYFIV